MSNLDDISKYIINKSIDDNKPINNIKLLNLLYYIENYYLKINKDLFKENFEAYGFGPCIPKIYYNYSGYGVGPIDIKETLNTNNIYKELPTINNIIKIYKPLEIWEDAYNLKRKGTPWYNTYNLLSDEDKKSYTCRNKIISKKLIKRYSSKFIHR